MSAQNELRVMLAAHFSACPRMEPQDAVKLLFQAEFGPGHMIKDEARSLARLLQEWDETPASAVGVYAQPLANGLYRVHLAQAKARCVEPSALNAAFAATAAQDRGSPKGFQEALALLEALCAQGLAPFSTERLRPYLERYRADGCPAVSHSAAYRAAYAPHYRVIAEEFWNMKPRP